MPDMLPPADGRGVTLPLSYHAMPHAKPCLSLRARRQHRYAILPSLLRLFADISFHVSRLDAPRRRSFSPPPIFVFMLAVSADISKYASAPAAPPMLPPAPGAICPRYDANAAKDISPPAYYATLKTHAAATVFRRFTRRRVTERASAPP